jgi:hypothetical protein
MHRSKEELGFENLEDLEVEGRIICKGISEK